MTDEMNRIFGVFWGQLVGDALGSRYEFMCSARVRHMIHADTHDGHLPMLGEGKFRKHAGQITDDSEMALSLARSLVQSKGFNHADIATAYACWYATSPPDAGMATSCALSIPALSTEGANFVLSDKRKSQILDEALKQAKTFNPKSLSNGMLMRISPLAIALRNMEKKKLQEIAKKECSITHTNAIVTQASQFFVTLLINLLKAQEPKEAIHDASKCVKEQLVLDIIADSEKFATPVRLPSGKTVDGDTECMGYFGVALQAALHELRTSNSFEHSIVRILSIGGDTDTNGCIAGALLGARFGVDAIPQDWITTVLNAPVDRDFPFMEPLKNKTIDSFVRELADLS